MKKITQIAFLFIFSTLFSVKGNSQGFAWLSDVDGAISSYYYGAPINGMAHANDGSTYIIGTFYFALTIGNMSVSNSTTGYDIYVAKIDSLGQTLWIKVISGTGTDLGQDIEVDNLGGLYISGAHTHNITFDTINIIAPTGVSGGSNNSQAYNFVAKLDTAGNTIWVKTGSKQGNHYGSPSKLKFANGSLYYMAHYQYRNPFLAVHRTFDGTLLPYTIPSSSSSTHLSSNFFVLKTSPAGVNDWITGITTLDGDEGKMQCHDMTVKSTGEPILQCNTQDSWKIGTTTYPLVGTGYRNNMIILELADSNGAFSNSNTLMDHGSYYTKTRGIDVDDNDNIYFLGGTSFVGSLELFGNDTLTQSGTYIAKLDSNFIRKKAINFTTLHNYSTRFEAIKVKNDEVLVGGTNPNVINLFGNSFQVINEGVFFNFDTAFTSLNWLTKTANTPTSSTYNWGAPTISDCAFGNNNDFYFSGAAGTSTTFGDLSLNSSPNAVGFITKIVKCNPNNVSISTSNPAICGVGATSNLIGTFSSNLTSNWLISGAKISGAVSATFVANNPGSYSLVIDSLGCKDTSNVLNITLSPIPSVSVPATALPICSSNGPVVIPDGIPSGGVWSGLGVVNDSIFDPSLTGTGPFTLTYTITNIDSCTNSALRIAYVVDPPTLIIPNPIPTFCETDSNYSLASIVYPPGGTYSGTGVIGNLFSPSIAGIGTHSITYTLGSFVGCEDSVTFNLTVYPTPIINFPAITPICESTPTLILSGATPTGGTYTGPNIWGNVYYTSFTGAGTYPVVYTVIQNGCSASDTNIIQIDSLPVAILSAIPSYCVNDSIMSLTFGSPLGGIYKINGIIDTIINPTLLGVGTHTLQYIYSNPCGSDTVSQSFVILGLPPIAMNSVGSFCEDSPAVTLTQGSPSGGIYSGNAVISGMFNPVIAVIGSNTIYYTLSDSNGCTATDSTIAIVHLNPTAIITADSSVCLNSNLITLNATPSGGTWSGTGVTGNQFNPSIVSAGNHIISYIISDTNSCKDTASHTITVNALPTVTLNPLTPICNQNSGPVLLIGGSPLGGVYSGIGVSNGNFIPSTTGPGFYQVAYTYTDTNGCISSDSQIVVVDTSAINIVFTPLANQCISSGIVALTGATPINGTYSGIGVTNNQFDPAVSGLGTFNITYSYTAPASCVTTSTQSITVDSLTPITFTSLTDLCADELPITLTQASPIGGIYSGIGVTGNQFDPVLSGVGQHTLTYTFTNGCVNSNTQTITVNPLPVTSLLGFAPLCFNTDSLVLTGGAPSGGVYSGVGVVSNVFYPPLSGIGNHVISYLVTDTNGCSNVAIDSIEVQFLTVGINPLSDVCIDAVPFLLSGGIPTGGIYSGTGVSTGQFDPSISGAGTFNIEYNYTNGVCTLSDTQQITVNALPIVSLVTNVSLCISDTSQLLNMGLPTGGIYSGTGVTGTNFNANLAGAGNIGITYTYTDTNGCINQAIDSILINGLPAVSLSGLNNMCLGDSIQVLSGGAPLNGVYTGWGVSSGGFDPMIAGIGSHVITYQFTDTNGCENSTVDTITVFAQPIVSLPSLSAICEGSSPISLTNGIPSGGIYSGIGVSAGIFDPTVSGTGTFTINYTVTTINGCISTDSTTITVHSLPNISFIDTNSFCEGDSSTLLLSGIPIGGTYTGIGINNGTFNPSIAGVGTHIITYQFTDSLGCSTSANQNFTVHSNPVVNYATSNTLCLSDSSFILIGGSPAGGIYSGQSITSNTFYPPISGVGQFDVTYTYTSSFGCSNADTGSITVISNPTFTSSDKQSMCEGESVNISATSVGNLIYQWTSGGTGDSIQVSPSSTKNYFVTGTDTNGCYSVESSLVVVNPNPVVNLAQIDSICRDSILTLDAGMGFLFYRWTTLEKTSSITIGPFEQDTVVTVGVRVSDIKDCYGGDTITIAVSKCEKPWGTFLLTVYPNPNNGAFTLRVENWRGSTIDLTLMSATSALIFKKRIEIIEKSFTYEFDMTHLASGAYFLLITGEDGVFRKKIIIAK